MLNLLPPEQRNILKQEERFRLLLILGFSVIPFLFSFILLLGALWVYLGGTIYFYGSQAMSLEERFADKEETAKEVKKINTTLDAVANLYEGQVVVSSILEEIGGALSEKMYLNSFQYIPESKKTVGEEVEIIPPKVLVTGFSSTRDELFAFRQALQESERIVSASFPPVNWIKPTDINFTFQANLNL